VGGWGGRRIVRDTTYEEGQEMLYKFLFDFEGSQAVPARASGIGKTEIG
jgi:hypothetical protein